MSKVLGRQENWTGNLHSAAALAQSIAEYWRAKGKHVTVQVESQRSKSGELLYSVRSDLVNGFPRR